MTPDANDNPNALPKHVQVRELLIRNIASGRLLDGEKLPPERDMADELGIAVGTLRKALANLVERGLLERVQGSGNYVRHGGASDAIYAMFRIELHGGGGLPRADLLDTCWMKKPDDLPAFGTDRFATRIRRLRYLDETIIAVEEIWLDGAAGKPTAAQLSDSLYHFYQKQLGFWVQRAEDRVTIGPVPDWAPKQFTLKPGTLTGFIERYSWVDAPEAFEYSRTWFDTNNAVYVQRMK